MATTGNIFEPGFDYKEFPYKELRELEEANGSRPSPPSSSARTSEAMIKRYIEEGNRAGAEASDLGGRGARGAGGAEFDGDDLADDLEELEIVDEKKITLPFKILYHREIGTGDLCATVIVTVFGGQYYAKVVKNDVILELVTKPTLYDPATWLNFMPLLDSLSGGPFLQVFEEEGKTLKENPDDFDYPDRIRHYAVFPIKFDIEQNFMPIGRMPAKAEYPHPDGSKTLMFNRCGAPWQPAQHEREQQGVLFAATAAALCLPGAAQPQPQPQQHFPQQPAQYPFFQPQQQQQQQYYPQQQPNFWWASDSAAQQH